VNTITAIIEPDADGTLHLPVPAEWRNRPVRVKASLDSPLKNPGDLL
jgi:hypothetical protein